MKWNLKKTSLNTTIRLKNMLWNGTIFNHSFILKIHNPNLKILTLNHIKVNGFREKTLSNNFSYGIFKKFCENKALKKCKKIVKFIFWSLFTKWYIQSFFFNFKLWKIYKRNWLQYILQSKNMFMSNADVILTMKTPEQ